jgi:transcriptional regulator with XRE-family HTH domain
MDNSLLKEQIGLKVKQLRTIKSWSREQMADKIGISVAAYGCIERGDTDISVTRLAQLAEIFEITLSDLLGLTEKNVFNYTQAYKPAYYKTCHNLQVNSPPSATQDSTLQYEIEKYQLIQQSQQKEIEHLQRQLVQLEEINRLLREKD